MLPILSIELKREMRLLGKSGLSAAVTQQIFRVGGIPDHTRIRTVERDFCAEVVGHLPALIIPTFMPRRKCIERLFAQQIEQETRAVNDLRSSHAAIRLAFKRQHQLHQRSCILRGNRQCAVGAPNRLESYPVARRNNRVSRPSPLHLALQHLADFIRTRRPLLAGQVATVKRCGAGTRRSCYDQQQAQSGEGQHLHLNDEQPIRK